VPYALFIRHWFGALGVDVQGEPVEAIDALWGSMFTVLSFLTTTGFESAGWGSAQSWSGLSTPGVVLIGLALLGGGVATTAGGVKLLRVYALYRHGRQEMALLVQPHGVAGVKSELRRVHPQGAQAAWIFFMLFALSIAVVSGLFSLAGVDFETAMVMTVAGLSTTGPLLTAASETPISLAGQSGAVKAIFGAAMILGRLETLAIIALLNPEFWRR
jgi:trk system potassium uptake protein TrkH